MQLRDALTPEGDILIGQMKASELATHGLAAAQSVISSANPLATLREVSSNYPSVVATLSKGRYQEQVRVNASDVQRMIGGCASHIRSFTLLRGLSVSRAETTSWCSTVASSVPTPSIPSRTSPLASWCWCMC